MARAIDVLQRAVAISTSTDGAAHPLTLSIRLSLAERLVEQHRDAQARDTLNIPMVIKLEELSPMHPFQAQLARVQGLLALHAGDRRDAAVWLARARQIYEKHQGPGSWRVARARRELALTGT
jgi:hypothetical protein